MSIKELLADVKAEVTKLEKHIETDNPQFELLLTKVSAHLHFVTDGLEPAPNAPVVEADAEEEAPAEPTDSTDAADVAPETEAPAPKPAAKRTARKRA